MLSVLNRGNEHHPYTLLVLKSDTIKVKDTKRINVSSRCFGVFMTPLSSEIIIQVDNLQNQSELAYLHPARVREP